MSIASRARHTKRPNHNSRLSGPRLYSVAKVVGFDRLNQCNIHFHRPRGEGYSDFPGYIVRDDKPMSRRDLHRADAEVKRQAFNHAKFHGDKSLYRANANISKAFSDLAYSA